HRHLQVGPRKRRLELQGFVEELRGAGAVSITNEALARDLRQLLCPFGNLATAGQADFPIALADGPLVRLSREADALAHQLPGDPDVAVVRQQSAVEQDAFRVRRGSQGGQPVSLQRPLTLASQRLAPRVRAVVDARSNDAKVSGHRAGLRDVALL